MLRHFYDATWGRKPLRRGRASGKQTYSGPLGKADRNGAFSPYGTGNERERGIVSAPLRKTNRERVQGERLYVTIYYVLIKRKKTIRGPMRSKQERTSKPPPPPLQPSLKGEGWSLGMREGSFQEDMADVANESTAGTAGGERAAVLALRADGEESELRDAAGTGSGGVHGGVALGHPGGAGYGQDISVDDFSGAVSCLLFAFLLPANAPWWLVMLGAALAIGLGKMAFGGLGANAVNTALVGWAMLYVSWPALMDPNSMQLDTSFIDPLVRLKYFGAGAVSHIGLTDLLLGNQIGGLGASQAGALFIGGSYLAARGTIRWEIALSFFVGVFLTAALYNVIDAERFATPFFHLCTGSTFLGGFFLATEWASSPGRQIPMMLYGLIGGAMVIIIRVYGIYPDGVPFAILLINLLAPLLDSIHPKPFGAR